MHECHILVPELFRLVSPLRTLLGQMLEGRALAEVQLTLLDQGPDVLLKNVRQQGLASVERLTAFAADWHLGRLSVDHGIGPETIFEPEPATITLSGTPVAFPVGGFLQATRDGEASLVESVREVLGASEPVADLFSGLGTFALGLGATYAAEASRDAAAALKRARPGMAIDHRDLYRRPLDASELKAFSGLVLDPPRAGASEQVRLLARSSVRRIAYVSCNPATFARDANTLTEGGYKLHWAQPIGQFRWSTHVELVACFSRDEAERSPRAS